MIASTDQPAPDPDLLTLVPRRSPGRTLALVVGGLALVALAAVSPQLRPALVDDSSYGGMQALLPSGDVMSGVILEPRRLLTTGVRAIADMDGAHLVGAWIAHGAEPHGAAADTSGAADAESYLEIAFPSRAPIPADLPDTAYDGETWLVLQWRPDGCVQVWDHSALDAAGPVATVLGPLGIPFSETLPDVAGPVLLGPADTTSALPMCVEPTL